MIVAKVTGERRRCVVPRGRLFPRDQYGSLRDRPRPGDPLDPAAAISIRGLGKRYGEFVAVDGLDLDIRRGEIFALLGPNGAGKTTTVEICEGYRGRDAGDVRVLGEDPAQGGRRWKAQLGIVLQSGAGESQLTVPGDGAGPGRSLSRPAEPRRGARAGRA